uniref:Uncharacterized protein n=1 Tax=Syphacia muris TaxID=451379 RepID=A0A0N5ATQ9_9BILA
MVDLRESSTPLRTQEGDVLPDREQYASPGSGRRTTRMGVVCLPDYKDVSPDTRGMRYLQRRSSTEDERTYDNR